MYPLNRIRRLRYNEKLRNLVSETKIDIDRMIMPVFVDESLEDKKLIESMTGIYQHSLNSSEEYAKHLNKIGVKWVLLFGIPKTKDAQGTQSHNDQGIIQRAIPIFKENGLGVITDLCMCEYTNHGHCGILRGNTVDNDATIKVYGKIAESQANSGADIIAPSGMMDGQVKVIREALDNSGHDDTPIMSYSSKYSSALYGPFREAAKSSPSFGDRKTYQMNPANRSEAMREIALDIEEGTDIIMVKPALFYMDIVRMAKDMFNLPLAAYSVSGEYQMIRNAVDRKFLPEAAIEESTISIFRGGADIVISYFTEYLATSRNA
ncbi:MAG: porphobilinogen synthase [Thermoplasmataceae archaeon]